MMEHSGQKKKIVISLIQKVTTKVILTCLQHLFKQVVYLDWYTELGFTSFVITHTHKEINLIVVKFQLSNKYMIIERLHASNHQAIVPYHLERIHFVHNKKKRDYNLKGKNHIKYKNS